MLSVDLVQMALLQNSLPGGFQRGSAAWMDGMAKPMPARYCTTSWSAFDAALRMRPAHCKRGSSRADHRHFRWTGRKGRGRFGPAAPII
ncbi:hypothetical protein [Limimaricola litoreus]|uniref:Uncharacterized protein n=1 Tax=Limimaricola litoreus TaxID=2955316 RepID=A0A9X2JNF3_9RHOB|nr:hypothetical protein [Limimaricola litoreus]MCP1168313.1 hypothetical protein [Limimaricola litoreus]